MALRQNDGDSLDPASDEEPQGYRTVTCTSCGDVYDPDEVGTFLRFPTAGAFGEAVCPGTQEWVGISVRERVPHGAASYAPGDTNGCGIGTAIHSHQLP